MFQRVIEDIKDSTTTALQLSSLAVVIAFAVGIGIEHAEIRGEMLHSEIRDEMLLIEPRERWKTSSSYREAAAREFTRPHSP